MPRLLHQSSRLGQIVRRSAILSAVLLLVGLAAATAAEERT